MNDGVTITLPPEAIDTIVELVADKVIATLEARELTWPAFMSIATLATYVDMPVERIRKLIARHEIPYLQEAPGCRVFFDRVAIDTWLRESAHPVRGGGA